LAATDGGSGVLATHYTTDGSTPTTSSPTYSGPISVTATKDVKFLSVDNVGNQETVQTLTVTITGGGGSSIAYVQQAVQTGSATSLTVPLSAASVSGNTLVAAVALAAGSSASVLDIKDSSGVSWDKTAAVIGFQSGINSRVEIWYRLGAPSVTSVTVTLSASKSLAVNVSEWSGVATASQPDASAHAGAGTGTTVTTPSLATSNATDLVIAASNYPAVATASLAAGPFVGLNPFGTSSVHGNAAYVVTTASGSYQATWNLSAASGGHGTAILALKGA
jgi:hypothetical protein